MCLRHGHVKVSGGSLACQIGPRYKTDKKSCSRVMTGEGKIAEGKRPSEEEPAGFLCLHTTAGNLAAGPRLARKCGFKMEGRGVSLKLENEWGLNYQGNIERRG